MPEPGCRRAPPLLTQGPVRILITDGEQRSSLAAVRSLGRAGHEVYVCSAHAEPLAGASRFARAVFQVPDPSDDPGGFVTGVDALVADGGIELLLPMTDVSVPLLIDASTRHPRLRIPLPDSATFRRVSDKVWLAARAEALGVPVPAGLVLQRPPSEAELADPAGALQAMAREAGMPLIVKPGRSAVHGTGGTERFAVRQAATLQELEAVLRDAPPQAYPLLVQQRVSGPGLGAFMLVEEGRTLASFGHRRLREKPPTGGVSVYRESVPLRRDVEEHAARILSDVGWTGVAMVEFKEDASTGVAYLMEINGRFWGSLQLAVDAGVDFPKILADMVRGELSEPAPKTKAGVRSRWLWGDVDHLIAVLRAPPGYRKVNPELPSRLGAVGRFFVPWRPGDRFEVLDVDDMRPFLRETRQWFAAL